MKYQLTNSTNIVVDSEGSFHDAKTSQIYLAWLAEGNTPEPADPVPNPRIEELKSELAALDIKRIRPTAEGDTDYLTVLNAQAVAIRAELQALL